MCLCIYTYICGSVYIHIDKNHAHKINVFSVFLAPSQKSFLLFLTCDLFSLIELLFFLNKSNSFNFLLYFQPKQELWDEIALSLNHSENYICSLIMQVVLENKYEKTYKTRKITIWSFSHKLLDRGLKTLYSWIFIPKFKNIWTCGLTKVSLSLENTVMLLFPGSSFDKSAVFRGNFCLYFLSLAWKT